MSLVTNNHFNLITQVAWRVLNLLINRKALLHPAGTVFYVWQRGDRIIVAFDPSTIDARRVNEDFAHELSTALHGRRVVFTNSRGLFLQVGFDIPAAPASLDATPLDLSQQPSPYHMPVGMTREGPLWISLLEGDSFLIGGSRGGGKTGEEHAWIQALLHGGKTEVYAWDGKRGAEFGRYVGHEHFHLMFSGLSELEDLRLQMRARESVLTWSGYPNIVMHNDAGLEYIPPIALFVDEAADLPDAAKELLKQMIRLYRHAGLYPIIATNQPTQAEVFAKTNLSTRVAFRVPHHTDSVTMLGYKGAEALPDLRGRGLIVWKGKFIEFQSFEVTYPMPTEAARQLITESQAPKKTDEVAQEEDQSELVKQLHADGLSNTQIVYKVWGASGSSFSERMRRVKEILAAAAASNTPGSPLNGAVGAQQ